MHTLKQQVF
uniref:Superoxide dismutase (SOD-1) gene exon 5 and 3' flanking region n=1 Tax=Homo sapiens TaxID=9606 RepID=V9H101_HUMAN|nr:unnamed protein product [Homo sapiens]